MITYMISCMWGCYWFVQKSLVTKFTLSQYFILYELHYPLYKKQPLHNFSKTLIEHTLIYVLLLLCPMQCILVLHTLYSILQVAPKELLYPFIPQYIDMFAGLLTTASGQQQQLQQSNDDDDDGHHVICKEVISSLTSLVKCYPKMMTGHLATVLQPIWNVVISSTNEYP